MKKCRWTNNPFILLWAQPGSRQVCHCAQIPWGLKFHQDNTSSFQSLIKLMKNWSSFWECFLKCLSIWNRSIQWHHKQPSSDLGKTEWKYSPHNALLRFLMKLLLDETTDIKYFWMKLLLALLRNLIHLHTKVPDCPYVTLAYLDQRDKNWRTQKHFVLQTLKYFYK